MHASQFRNIKKPRGRKEKYVELERVKFSLVAKRCILEIDWKSDKNL